MKNVRPLSAVAFSMLAAGSSLGQAHEALVLVNPNNAESLHVANYYADARGVPHSGLAYFDPSASNFADFSATRVPALLGTIANHRNEASIDYVILTSKNPYRISASGYVSDGCVAVSLFSLTGCYTLARFDDEVLGGTTSLLSNGYFDTDGEARAFDNALSYHNGEPGVGTPAGKPFIGAALGHTGTAGTDKATVLSMIDTAVAADGTFPAGTFHFLQTNDAARSGPRHDFYTSAVNEIVASGGDAVKTIGPVLPSGGAVVAGAMTGAANPDIAGGDFSFAPGAFADHLTSFAATFDTPSQAKMTRWIEKGAVFTFGAVQEPCNYPNKFPKAFIHNMYFDGLTIGESCLRSLQAVPFQGMMLGDPLCRPYAHIPDVNPGDLPMTTVSGNFSFTPTATTTHPTASIATFEVYIDGVLRASDAAGNPLLIRTTFLDDGWHEIRVVAYDNTLVATQGEWVGGLITNNNGKVISFQGPQTSIDRSGIIQVTAGANDPNVTEVRLLHNDRVVAASDTIGTLQTRGEIVGAGPARVRVEMDFADGTSARTIPFTVDVDDTNPPAGGGAPIAFDFTKTVKPGQAYVLELPAMHNTAVDEPSFSITSGPTQGSVLGGSGRFRIVQADAGATGTDQISFSVNSDGQSDSATVAIIYYDPDAEPCLADTNLDGTLNFQDFTFWIFAYNSNLVSIGDINQDGFLTPTDFTAWIAAYNTGCDF
ncbi:MAG: hypothetical protein Phyf2KO_26260 [Phycisphaerales bacterium]